MVAYAAVHVCQSCTHIFSENILIIDQARFALSSQDEWQLEDGAFKYKEFFDNIIILFDDESDAWYQDTLDWFEM